MKQKIMIALLSLFVFVGCSKSVSKEDISKLNGYWEIEKVVFEGGEDKVYKVNESYDFFKVDNSGVGFCQKVMPQLDGKFLTNGLQENIKVRFTEDKTFLDYKTVYAKWSQEIVKLTEEELVLKNEENKEYFYKRTQKIDVLNHGKEVK